ncbi:Fatty-acid amide hydrolase [Echinococcus granulosus]|uniref:Fatty-acid amide hydrolase n=1 Tax=Echinococcus granulosus TaxID=6210 RepID=W6U373_ECHGR|nr:Fatty-acid amide hydrolase [Echinococcus granulosus]EUB55558.1 Fatty-acid amide hydrolase [Echinococcus granulosus]
MNFYLSFLCTVLDGFSCLYIIVNLGIPALISTIIIKSATSIQSYSGSFYLNGIICSFWLCSRIGVSLFRLFKGQKRLSRKKLQRQGVINSISAKLCGLKTPLERVDEVTSLSMAQLRHRIVVLKDLSSLESLEALQVHLIRLMHSPSSCIAEIVFDADVTAIVADHMLKQNQRPLSALHGIPVCLSNCFSIKGEDCNTSTVFKAGYSQDADCCLVQDLRKIGANPVALATTGLLPGEPDASSRLYGTVRHPTHPNRVVGSTSIAVIVQQKGAFLGFGLDILGDVRLAAANVGVVGFKPTTQRLSIEGVVNVVNFPKFLPPTVGIVGLHVSDITDAMISLASVHTDLLTPPVPFKADMAKKNLVIGVCRSYSSIIPVVPAVERVMIIAEAALKAKGHNVVDVELPEPEEAVLLALQVVLSCCSYWNVHIGQHHGSSLTWDEIIKCCLPKIPLFLRGLFSLVIQWQQKAKCNKMKRLLKVWNKPLSAESIHKALETHCRKFSDLWSDEEIDLLIGPAAPAPALLKESSASLAFLQAGYSTIFNIVNCPAGVVPLGRVTQEDIKQAVEVQAPPHSLEAQLLEQQKTAEGLPLAVQVVAKPWADELALRVMQELEEVYQH